MAFYSWRTRLLALFVTTAIAGCSTLEGTTGTANETTIDPLVTAEWLSEHLDDPDLVVLDCTVVVEPDGDGGFSSKSGLANYDAGHIPTAGFANLLGELSDGDSTLRFAVPAPEQFAAAMMKLGVSDKSRVVLYDANGSAWAARVWWMLRWIGFDRAALLDGGLTAWTAQGQPLSTTPANRPAGSLTVALRPELVVGKQEVLASIADDSVNLIDALPEASYRGEMTLYARPGHIAGASNVSMRSLMDETGHFLPEAELEQLFAQDRDARAITYCGGGIAASANAFIMTLLGYEDVAVYTASLQEWASDESLPMEVAPER